MGSHIEQGHGGPEPQRDHQEIQQQRGDGPVSFTAAMAKDVKAGQGEQGEGLGRGEIAWILEEHGAQVELLRQERRQATQPVLDASPSTPVHETMGKIQQFEDNHDQKVATLNKQTAERLSVDINHVAEQTAKERASYEAAQRQYMSALEDTLYQRKEWLKAPVTLFDFVEQPRIDSVVAELIPSERDRQPRIDERAMGSATIAAREAEANLRASELAAFKGLAIGNMTKTAREAPEPLGGALEQSAEVKSGLVENWRDLMGGRETTSGRSIQEILNPKD